MKITVEIPTALRRFTDGSSSVECAPATLAELLAELERKFPGMARHLRDDSGRVRQFLNIYVNEEDIRFLGGESYRFQDGDRVMLVPSIAGGSSAPPRSSRAAAKPTTTESARTRRPGSTSPP